MTLAQFKVRFPEFRTADDSLVSAVLAESGNELNSEELGDAYNAAHGLLAAHKLAISPFGQSARMVNDEGETTYNREFIAVVGRAVAPLAVT